MVAFESAARHGNISRAAQELNTSQPAISRYIARLEKQLGARLFERTRTGVNLTDAGRRYREAVLTGLGALSDGAAEAAALAGAGSPEMAITCPDELSHLFAMQRYDALGAALGGEVRVRLLARADDPAPAPPEPAADVVLTWDAGSAALERHVVIAREAVGAFCSPRYAAAHAGVLTGPVTHWGGLTFLALAEPGEGRASWERWFESAGRPSIAPRYRVVGGHAHALEEAVSGRGLVLGWRHLIARHVEAGALVMRGGEFVETGRSFQAELTARGRERPPARACLAFFAGAAKHRGGWNEP